MSSAYLLVSHGSRDPRPEIAMQQLAGLVNNIVQSNLPGKNHTQTDTILSCKKLVGIAFLELSSEPLHEQIKQFVQNAFTLERVDSQWFSSGSLKIVPLFLLPGVHVMTDIPAEVALAQYALSQDIKIELQPYLGTHPGLKKLLAKQMATIKTQTWILLAHGSRRPLSLEPIEAMATSLGAVTAYWAVPPSLESRVTELVAAGYREIAVLPYFLFAGGITDAIANSVETLKLQFPAVTFQLAKPLGASAELADLIWDLTDR